MLFRRGPNPEAAVFPVRLSDHFMLLVTKVRDYVELSHKVYQELDEETLLEQTATLYYGGC